MGRNVPYCFHLNFQLVYKTFMHGIELRSLFLLFTEITACHLSAGSGSFIISFSTDYYEILPVMLTDVLAGQYGLNQIFLLN